MSLIEDLVFRLSRRAIRRQDPEFSKPTSTYGAYQTWRNEELLSQYRSHFSEKEVAAKDVLDFGCGSGELSLLCAHDWGARHVTGTDLNARGIATAKEKAAQLGLREKTTFFAAGASNAISLPSSSQDVILCFDVMEHVLDYREIIPEWHRVLRPGGQVLIFWIVWMHPYGHHLHSMIPLPWVHLIVPEETLLRVSARIYELPEFRPRYWHLDGKGEPKPNPYAGQKSLGHLNRLTTAVFDRIARQAGFLVHQHREPFQGGRLRWLKKGLVHLPPPFRDMFCSSFVYRLTKPVGAKASKDG